MAVSASLFGIREVAATPLPHLCPGRRMPQSPTWLWGESRKIVQNQNFLVSLPACPPHPGTRSWPSISLWTKWTSGPAPDDSKASCSRVLGRAQVFWGFPLFPSFKEIPVWPLGTKGVTLTVALDKSVPVSTGLQRGTTILNLIPFLLNSYMNNCIMLHNRSVLLSIC